MADILKEGEGQLHRSHGPPVAQAEFHTVHAEPVLGLRFQPARHPGGGGPPVRLRRSAPESHHRRGGDVHEFGFRADERASPEAFPAIQIT